MGDSTTKTKIDASHLVYGPFRINFYGSSPEEVKIDVSDTRDGCRYLLSAPNGSLKISSYPCYSNNRLPHYNYYGPPPEVEEAIAQLHPQMMQTMEDSIVPLLLKYVSERLPEITTAHIGLGGVHYATLFIGDDPASRMRVEMSEEGESAKDDHFQPQRLALATDDFAISTPSPEAMRWMENLVRYLKLDEISKRSDQSRPDLRLSKQTLSVSLPRRLFQFLPQKMGPHERYEDQVDLMLEGIPPQSDPSITQLPFFLFEPEPITHEPLPYYRSITIPASLSAGFQQLIDIDGDRQ